MRKPDPNEAVRKQLQGRIDRLESFTNMAEALVSDLKQRVRELPEAK